MYAQNLRLHSMSRLKIIQIIEDNPEITAQEIARLLGMHIYNVQHHLKKIETECIIQINGEEFARAIYFNKEKGSHSPYRYTIIK